MISFSLNQVFKIAREARGISQSELAEKAGITQAAISQFEMGRSSLSSDILEKFCPSLAINPDYLSGKTENPFLSDSVIFMNLGIADGNVNLDPLFLLLNFNRTLEIVSIYMRPSVAEPNFYAIAVKDEKNNLFLFQRKGVLFFPKDLVLEERLRTGLNVFVNVSFSTKRAPSLLEKIRRGTLKRNHLEKLFQSISCVSVEFNSLDTEELFIAERLKELKESSLFKKKLCQFLREYQAA